MKRVDEVMTKPVEMVHESTQLNFAAQKMRDLNIGFLVVGNGEIPTGCITDRDIVVSAVARGMDPRQHRVGEAMTRVLFSCESGRTVGEALRLMNEYKVYRLVITDSQKNPVGVVSFGDLVAFAEDDEDEALAISEVLRNIARTASVR